MLSLFAKPFSGVSLTTIDNLETKQSGDYDSDEIHKVYWKTADGNIRYANYQSEDQTKEYLTANGDDSVITDITS